MTIDATRGLSLSHITKPPEIKVSAGRKFTRRRGAFTFDLQYYEVPPTFTPCPKFWNPKGIYISICEVRGLCISQVRSTLRLSAKEVWKNISADAAMAMATLQLTFLRTEPSVQHA